MKWIKWIQSNKILYIIPLVLMILAAVYVAASDRRPNDRISEVTSKAPQKTDIAATPSSGKEMASESGSKETSIVLTEYSDDTVKAILNVEGMSCSGCIATIKSSLAGYAGIRDVIVNISAGITEIYYDSLQMTEPDLLAAAITDSGYPAKVKRLISAEQLRQEEALAAQRAKLYVASVGGWDISRSEFETEVAYAKNRYTKAYGQDVFSDERGRSVLDNIKDQVVVRLVNEGIQMQEIQRVGYRVDAEIVGQEFDSFITQKGISLDQFKTALSASGYPFDYFKKKFENRVLLRRYIEDHVIHMSASDYDKQQQYLTWFNNAKALSTVVIYDKQLERLSQKQSSGGCGSSCKS